MSQRRPTSLEVARRAGVSRTTVSFVLNDVQTSKISAATRERVLKAASELGYVPDAAARSLVSGKTGTIGLVVSRAEHIRVDAFIPQTIYSLSRICMQGGYRLLIETAEEGGSAYNYDQLVGAKAIDGLVVLNPDPADHRLGDLIDRGFPAALIGAYPHPEAAAVSVDSASAMDRATTHLVENGHHRIGFIHYRQMTRLDEGGRFGGYRAALERAGLPLQERWVRSGDYSAASGYEAMRSILEDDPPYAIVAGNDTIALGAIAAITESGRRIPEDIAIVGFDDIPQARFMNPPLTTVNVPAAEMAETCGQVIMELIRNGRVGQPKRVFQAELVVRASSGAPGV